MDTRFTAEQAELRDSARRLAADLGPATVAALDDDTRAKRLAAAVRDAGWLEMRDDDGNGAPLASGVEAAIVAEALGGAVADVAFTGPLLARDLARRAGVDVGDAAVAFGRDLVSLTNPVFVVDGAAGIVVFGDGTLGALPVAGDPCGSDLTRAVYRVGGGAAGSLGGRAVTGDDLESWMALGLALTCADLVGVMRGVLDVTVAYAADRKQYGVPVGSFQSVQHLLAEARCLLEGSHSVALHAAWSVDDRDPRAAILAGRVAKAYCARAARTVCETAIQVHGGIGNTWECLVHVYLRRALLSSEWFGDDARHVTAISDTRLRGDDGLS
jgi:alkylation response protein AidB-like acyl-CoA dehydrogenase